MRKIKRDDNVLVLAGKDRGKVGVVRSVIGGGDLVKVKGHRPKVTEDLVFVTGLNLSKRHKRQQPGVTQARREPTRRRPPPLRRRCACRYREAS